MPGYRKNMFISNSMYCLTNIQMYTSLWKTNTSLAITYHFESHFKPKYSVPQKALSVIAVAFAQLLIYVACNQE